MCLRAGGSYCELWLTLASHTKILSHNGLATGLATSAWTMRYFFMQRQLLYFSLLFSTSGELGERWQQKAWCHCLAYIWAFIIKRVCQIFYWHGVTNSFQLKLYLSYAKNCSTEEKRSWHTCKKCPFFTRACWSSQHITCGGNLVQLHPSPDWKGFNLIQT